MLPKSESKDAQKSTRTICEESKAERDAPINDSMTNSIKTGTLLNQADKILFFHSFNLSSTLI